MIQKSKIQPILGEKTDKNGTPSWWGCIHGSTCQILVLVQTWTVAKCSLQSFELLRAQSHTPSLGKNGAQWWCRSWVNLWKPTNPPPVLVLPKWRKLQPRIPADGTGEHAEEKNLLGCKNDNNSDTNDNNQNKHNHNNNNNHNHNHNHNHHNHHNHHHHHHHQEEEEKEEKEEDDDIDDVDEFVDD